MKEKFYQRAYVSGQDTSSSVLGSSVTSNQPSIITGQIIGLAGVTSSSGAVAYYWQEIQYTGDGVISLYPSGLASLATALNGTTGTGYAWDINGDDTIPTGTNVSLYPMFTQDAAGDSWRISNPTSAMPTCAPPEPETRVSNVCLSLSSGVYSLTVEYTTRVWSIVNGCLVGTDQPPECEMNPVECCPSIAGYSLGTAFTCTATVPATLTIPGVTIPANTMLVVFSGGAAPVGIAFDGNALTAYPPAVGPTPEGCGLVICWYYYVTTDTTGDIVLTGPGNPCFMTATGVTGLTLDNPFNSGCGSTASTGNANPLTICQVEALEPNNFMIAAVMMSAPSQPGYDWEIPLIDAGQDMGGQCGTWYFTYATAVIPQNIPAGPFCVYLNSSVEPTVWAGEVVLFG